VMFEVDYYNIFKMVIKKCDLEQDVRKFI